MRRIIEQIGASVRSLAARMHAREDARNWSYERLTYEVLREEQPLDLVTLIDRVARAAMHAEGVGGAHLDITVWGPRVFHREATAAVRRMIGRTLVLEADGPGILVTPVTRAGAFLMQREAGTRPVTILPDTCG